MQELNAYCRIGLCGNFYPKGVSELTNYVGELIFGEVSEVGSGI